MLKKFTPPQSPVAASSRRARPHATMLLQPGCSTAAAAGLHQHRCCGSRGLVLAPRGLGGTTRAPPARRPASSAAAALLATPGPRRHAAVIQALPSGSAAGAGHTDNAPSPPPAKRPLAAWAVVAAALGTVLLSRSSSLNPLLVRTWGTPEPLLRARHPVATSGLPHCHCHCLQGPTRWQDEPRTAAVVTRGRSINAPQQDTAAAGAAAGCVGSKGGLVLVRPTTPHACTHTHAHPRSPARRDLCLLLCRPRAGAQARPCLARPSAWRSCRAGRGAAWTCPSARSSTCCWARTPWPLPAAAAPPPPRERAGGCVLHACVPACLRAGSSCGACMRHSHCCAVDAVHPMRTPGSCSCRHAAPLAGGSSSSPRLSPRQLLPRLLPAPLVPLLRTRRASHAWRSRSVLRALRLGVCCTRRSSALRALGSKRTCYQWRAAASFVHTAAHLACAPVRAGVHPARRAHGVRHHHDADPRFMGDGLVAAQRQRWVAWCLHARPPACSSHLR